MSLLKAINKISIYILYLAATTFVAGGTLALALSPSHLIYALLATMAIAIFSIPLTLASLIQAYRTGVVSSSYILFSILISCFIAGLGWFVIPFALNRDIKQCMSELAAAKEAL